MHKHEKQKPIDSKSSVIIDRKHTKKDTETKDTTEGCLCGLISRNELNTHVGEFGAICQNLSNFNSIERLILDFNFYNKKKGYCAPIVTELVNSSTQMKSIQILSIRGNYDNNDKINSKTLHSLQYDNLIPLFEYINNGTNNANKQTNSKKNSVQFLYLDGNHLGEKVCKMLDERLKFNSKLEILSCENCRISLKGLKLLLACVTAVASIYDILSLQTLKVLNLEKIEAIYQAHKIRRKTEARKRRKTIEKDGKNGKPKTQAVKNNHAASADKDLLATGDDDESSTDDLLGGYATPGVGFERSPMMTGKSRQTKVLRLARVLQNNNSGGLPISMGAQPSDVILLVVASDSGGPSDPDGNAANNCPFRGGKYSDFEGGIRVVSIVSGGFDSIIEFKFKNENVDYGKFFNGIIVSNNGFNHGSSSTPVPSLLILSTQWYLIVIGKM